MKGKVYILILISALTLSACVEEVLIDVTPADQKMVVSSLFIPDSIVIVTVTRSFSALSGKDIEALGDDLIASLLVDRGLVTIHSLTDIDTLSRIAPGVYAGFVKNAKPLDSFELNVYDSTSRQSIRSVTQLKPQVKFDNVSVELKTDDGDTLTTLHYEFTDPADQENWYLVQAFELPDLPDFNYSINDEGEVVVETDTSNQFFFNPSIEPIFTDLIADIAQGSNVISVNKSLGRQPKDTLIYVLMNVDKGYFDFLQARRRSGGILQSLMREPVNHPTNVENGYGYFTMHLPHFKAYIRKED